MHQLKLAACTAVPFGSYLKALGVLRLVSEQAGANARGFWNDDTFVLESSLTADELLSFFLDRYEPTPILAPWNGGSGFYPKDNQEGIGALEASTAGRFAEYRDAIAKCRSFPEVQQGKAENEDERRLAILRRCRNELSNRAVEWLDAAVGISADGKRSFAPVLGTGGNEGRLDYTNNFMSRIAAMLISPDPRISVRELLSNALFSTSTNGLQPGAAGQFDPGRAGGANQGQGVFHDTVTNPWELILTLEGAVAWASGLYRRQGVGYRTVLCSPFTVRPRTVGYGSAAAKDDARAEVWTPLWHKPVRYDELRNLLREGRASIDGRPAGNTLEFAEAVCSLGVDRGIDRFVRYSLLKRRGDSYVALPAGIFHRTFRKESDLIREFQQFMDRLRVPEAAEDLRRNIDAAVYQVLLSGERRCIRELMAAFGRMLRRMAIAGNERLPPGDLDASRWLTACGFIESAEVRIGAALASIYTHGIGSMADNLSRTDKRFAWAGATLEDRMISVLERRLQLATAQETKGNPLGGACELHPGDISLFVERSIDDSLVEDLLFAFTSLRWADFTVPGYQRPAEVAPVYALLKHLFLPGKLVNAPEETLLRADPRVISLLRAGSIAQAAGIAVHRLRIAKLRPLNVSYEGGMEPRRLAASLLIPVRQGSALQSGIFHEKETTTYA